MKIVVREVGEDSVPVVKQFLASRKEFEYVCNWDPCFAYPWKLAQFPYGYAMFDGNEIVGFLGTMFSMRNIGGRDSIHCNIHTWIVDDSYRLRLGEEGRGVGRRLIEPLIKMRDVLITALTPSPRSKVSCERSGFESLDENQVVVPLVTAGLEKVPKESKPVRFVQAGEFLDTLTPDDRQIYCDHRHLPCRNFLVVNESTGEYCYFIATTSEVRKLGPKFKSYNLHLCYLSDVSFFTKHFTLIKKELWKRERVSLLRYDSRLIPARLSALTYTIPVLRMVRPADPNFREADDIYSELVAYNKY